MTENRVQNTRFSDLVVDSCDLVVDSSDFVVDSGGLVVDMRPR